MPSHYAVIVSKIYKGVLIACLGSHGQLRNSVCGNLFDHATIHGNGRRRRRSACGEAHVHHGERDNVVYWKTNGKINNHGEIVLACSDACVHRMRAPQHDCGLSRPCGESKSLRRVVRSGWLFRSAFYAHGSLMCRVAQVQAPMGGKGPSKVAR